MIYFQLSAQQQLLLQQFVRHQDIVDLGGGNGAMASLGVALGATSVLVVDKEQFPEAFRHKTVRYHQACFGDPNLVTLVSKHRRFILSWPINHNGLLATLPLLKGQLLYVGKNTEGSACGTPRFWQEITGWHRKAHVGARHNTVIWYCVRQPRLRQDAIREEQAGADQSRIWSYTA